MKDEFLAVSCQRFQQFFLPKNIFKNLHKFIKTLEQMLLAAEGERPTNAGVEEGFTDWIESEEPPISECDEEIMFWCWKCAVLIWFILWAF